MVKTYKINKAMVSFSTQGMKSFGHKAIDYNNMVVLDNPVIFKEIGILENYDWLGAIKFGVINKEIINPSINNLEEINNIVKNIRLINKKGFVNSIDIYDDKEFPILGKYISGLVDKGKIEDFSLLERIDLGKWSYNLLMLELLTVIEVSLYKIINGWDEEVEDTDYKDLLDDYKEMSRILINSLDPAIRVKLQRGGLSIIQNTYTGYDSEYQNVDLIYNKLISVQLAVSTKTLLKVPSIRKFGYSKIDTLSGKILPISLRNSKLDYDQILQNINKCIDKIRSLKYEGFDYSINKINDKFKDLKIPCIHQEDKDCIVYSFERTPIKTWFKVVDEEGILFKELVKISNKMALKDHDLERIKIIDILKDIHGDKVSDNYKLEINNSVTDLNVKEEFSDLDTEIIESKLGDTKQKEKRYNRTKMLSFTKEKVSVTFVKNNYFIGHLTNADLSILKDFDSLKESLDIVNNSFVTLSKPLLIDGVNVTIRDTMLLVPGSKKSLSSIGSLYGPDFNKIDIGDNIKNMQDFLLKDYELFKKYALQDSIITLVHACFMEEFNFKIGFLGIPLSLSSLSNKFVMNKWKEERYKGYQISPEYLIGDAEKTQTPKGLSAIDKTGLKLSLYIANYKGGRGESFMYGIDEKTKWFDYDLTSAYTTAMAMLGDPDYYHGRILKEKDLDKMSKEEILYSYTVIKCRFEFPKGLKYPSIPCYLDKTLTVYPLRGESILTGSEYLVAKSQGCKFKIDEIYYIPFTKIEDSKGKIIGTVRPFKKCIKELQNKRVTYAKGTINNLIYKEIGNAIYGLTVKGMSNKMKYDTKTKTTVRMGSGVLSNPIIASWTTAFMRSVLGELMHNISNLGGKIVSVTTDGFITNLENLEDLIIDKGNSFVFKEYKKMRESLSGNDRGLETKNEGIGIISWSTRGQFSFAGGIKASTGFQNKNIEPKELDILFKDTLNSQSKEINFIQFGLKSALEIFKHGGHVTPVYRDRIFRMHFDNRRTIIIPSELLNTFKDSEVIDYSNILLDSDPVESKDLCNLYRYYGNISKQIIYQRNTSRGGSKTIYKNYLDMAIRNFLKGLLNNYYNLDCNVFSNYKDIVTYIYDYVKDIDRDYRLTTNSLAQLKRRGVSIKNVIKTKETEGFVQYVKIKFPYFDEKTFFK